MTTTELSQSTGADAMIPRLADRMDNNRGNLSPAYTGNTLVEVGVLGGTLAGAFIIGGAVIKGWEALRHRKSLGQNFINLGLGTAALSAASTIFGGQLLTESEKDK